MDAVERGARIARSRAGPLPCVEDGRPPAAGGHWVYTTTASRGELRDVEELVIAGPDDGRLDYVVRTFGQSRDGERHVLVNENGVRKGTRAPF